MGGGGRWMDSRGNGGLLMVWKGKGVCGRAYVLSCGVKREKSRGGAENDG